MGHKYFHASFDFIQPESYLSHLIGHEGDGSLLSHLKKLGLASDLSSGEKNTAPGFSFFTVDIDLTIEGLRKRCLEEIKDQFDCFSYE